MRLLELGQASMWPMEIRLDQRGGQKRSRRSEGWIRHRAQAQEGSEGSQSLERFAEIGGAGRLQGEF